MEQQYEDLKGKYDTLAQHVLTMELERREYEKEMKQMATHNLELKQSNRANLEALELDQYSKMSLHTLSTDLKAADSLQQEISAQNDKYKDLNVELIEENNILKQQHKKYQLVLENMKCNAQKKEIEYQNKVEMLENKIVEYNNEQNKMSEKYDQMSKEMNSLKHEHRQQFKKQMEAASPAPDVGHRRKTLRLHFAQSITTNELYSMDGEMGQMARSYSFENHYDALFEKEQLIKNYVAETNELNQQIVSYKKQIMQKNIHINQLKSKQLNGVKNARSQLIQRPNNEHLSKCKVFGWAFW